MRVDKKFLIVSMVICLLPITMGLYFYNELPSSMAVHFGVDGQPDRFISRELGVVMLPIFLAMIQLILAVSVDLKQTAKKGRALIKSILPIFSVIFQSVLIIYAIRGNVEIAKLVIFIIGILFMVLGNYMPKKEFWGNYNIKLFGLEKNINEQKVIRVYSKFMSFSGFVIFCSGLFKLIVSIVIIIVFAVLSVIYPFYLAKKYKIIN
ncbi:DUF1648 domain-containing protein [Gemella cuniculi]|uniref:DUF1648 domain-containing protein n=1 Tax=Gemella cuniculi TaxID=150240 RepID=UPI000405F022|nr:DUF1648 domain-containing protein [Gemella cuniculi]